MDIIVKGDKVIAAIQQEFHEEFPFLKIEFFTEKTPVKNRAPLNQKFGVYGNNSHSEQITITPAMTVAELDNLFRARYNLSAQVLRKSGKAWLETTLTDNWTLQEQNEQGKSLSS